jgi:hypothetical protein
VVPTWFVLAGRYHFSPPTFRESNEFLARFFEQSRAKSLRRRQTTRKSQRTCKGRCKRVTCKRLESAIKDSWTLLLKSHLPSFGVGDTFDILFPGSHRVSLPLKRWFPPFISSLRSSSFYSRFSESLCRIDTNACRVLARPLGRTAKIDSKGLIKCGLAVYRGAIYRWEAGEGRRRTTDRLDRRTRAAFQCGSSAHVNSKIKIAEGEVVGPRRSLKASQRQKTQRQNPSFGHNFRLRRKARNARNERHFTSR